MTDGRTDRKKALLASYALLLAGAILLGLLFGLRSRIWEYVDPFPRVGLFALWLLAPVALLAANTWVVERFLYRGRSGAMFVSGALLFLLSEGLIYHRAVVVPRSEVMEINFVFLIGPFYHLAAAVFVTAGYLVRCARIILGESPGGQAPQPTATGGPYAEE